MIHGKGIPLGSSCMCDVSKVQDLISNQQMLIILLFHYSNIAIVVSLHLASDMLLSARYDNNRMEGKPGRDGRHWSIPSL